MQNLININAASVSLSVSSTSARVNLSARPEDYVLIDNSFPGAVDCYVKSGLSTATAATTDLHISAGEKATYQIDPSHTHIAAITASGTTTLRLVKGSGV
jgi:hypothetical protein